MFIEISLQHDVLLMETLQSGSLNPRVLATISSICYGCILSQSSSGRSIRAKRTILITPPYFVWKMDGFDGRY